MSTNTLNKITLTNPAAALQAFVDVLEKNEMTYTGGCTTFYTPEQWAARGEEYGKGALFIVVHDGGDVAHALRDRRLSRELNEALEAHGAYLDGCTCWYSAVYAVKP